MNVLKKKRNEACSFSKFIGVIANVNIDIPLFSLDHS